MKALSREELLELLLQEVLLKKENPITSGGVAPVPFEIGGKYYIRTVTYHVTGEVTKIVGNFLVLKTAAWIADSGRFSQAIVDGILNEVEPVKDEIFVNVNSITDAYLWSHKLPTTQK
ncbi:MAG: hypothetical protein AAB922_07780 [Patescibacteria group bacterium]